MGGITFLLVTTRWQTLTVALRPGEIRRPGAHAPPSDATVGREVPALATRLVRVRRLPRTGPGRRGSSQLRPALRADREACLARGGGPPVRQGVRAACRLHTVTAPRCHTAAPRWSLGTHASSRASASPILCCRTAASPYRCWAAELVALIEENGDVTAAYTFGVPQTLHGHSVTFRRGRSCLLAGP